MQNRVLVCAISQGFVRGQLTGSCLCLQFLGRALTLTSLAILEPELTALAEQEAQEMSNDLLNVSSNA